ncbi:B3 domain-containing transcription factor FUS3-like [Humulus lupulus]|uniref:B3 domain-containing transcription factor FUS3-like n=1 Tax=Humulus lupulus TaxID=3486 RepID=UPI002B409301|nr:B3 domain-containing transcription factor FUS3-like [Humulus lupulus]
MMMMMMEHQKQPLLHARDLERDHLGLVVTTAHDQVLQENRVDPSLSDPIGLTRDLLTTVTHRKKRLPRQRRSSSTLVNLHFLFPNPGSYSSSHVPQSSLPSTRGIDPGRLRFLFQKELKNSDVSSLRRMILPKKAAEAHLPVLESKEGMVINMDDLDGLHVWSFKYRFWPNNNSRMYVLENTGEFTNTHGLRLGDFIMVYQDTENQNYVIQAQKKTSTEQERHQDQDQDLSSSSFEEDYYLSNNIRSLLHMGESDDQQTNMSFIYDTTNFSNESLLDFLGGSSMTHNYSSKSSSYGSGPFGSFGSVDNLSLDDYY